MKKGVCHKTLKLAKMPLGTDGRLTDVRASDDTSTVAQISDSTKLGNTVCVLVCVGGAH